MTMTPMTVALTTTVFCLIPCPNDVADDDGQRQVDAGYRADVGCRHRCATSAMNFLNDYGADDGDHHLPLRAVESTHLFCRL